MVEPAAARREFLADGHGVPARSRAPDELPAPTGAGGAAAGGQAADDGRSAAGLRAAGWRPTRSCSRSPPASRSRCSSGCSGRSGPWSGPCPTRRPRSGAASPCCAPTRPPGRAQRALAERLMAAVGEVHWVDGRGADARGHRCFRQRPGLCLPPDRGAWPRRACGPGCRRSWRCASRAPPWSAPASWPSSRRDSAAQLRANVTSPGGTTAAALEVLMAADGLAPLMERAVAAAARRSRELA